MGTRSFRQSQDAEEQTFYVTFKPSENEEVPGLIDLSVHLKVLFETLMVEMKSQYGPDGWVRVFMQHRGEKNFQMVIKPQYIGNFNSEDVMFHIERVLHSAGFIPADENLIIALGVVRAIRGRGRREMFNHSEDVVKKKSLIGVSSSDGLCFPRAIVIGKARLDKEKAKGKPDEKEKTKAYHSIRDKRNLTQFRKASELVKSVGLTLIEAGSLQNVSLYEDHLKIGISVISKEALNEPVYNGNKMYDDRIFILHSRNSDGTGHFDCITSMKGLLCKQNYCSDCHKSYHNRDGHSCSTCCKICGFNSCRVGLSVICNVCNRSCRSKSCLSRHQKGFTNKTGKKLKGLCSSKWLCPVCKVLIKDAPESVRVKNHACGETFCSVCKQFYLNEHKCFMKIEREKKSARKFIFFDFECRQESDIHTPNLVVVQTSCEICKDFTVDELSQCDNCGFRCSDCSCMKGEEFERKPCSNPKQCSNRRFFWKGENTRDAFCIWLFSKQNVKSKVFAHNAKSYDAYFLLAFLKDQGKKPDHIIMTGSKIMHMKIAQGLNIELLDSLNFLPMPLASLPKSFGLTELKKGYFPHLFNTLENENVVLDSLPPSYTYNPDQMSIAKRKEFFTWYETHKHDTFDMQKEMLEYCISDVNILQEACMKFRKLVFEVAPEVDAFCYITIASLCFGIFRSKFLPETYSVLQKKNAQNDCTHGYLCSCTWSEARKKSKDAPLEIHDQGSWLPLGEDELKLSRFVNSPIATVPPDEYGVKGNHSIPALEWLLWKSRCLNVHIQHARNGGEKLVQYKSNSGISRYKLDGFFEVEGKKHALEFYGCNWHGCPECFPGNRDEPIPSLSKTLSQLLRETKLKEVRLEEMGFTVHSIWGCQFEKLKKDHPEIETVVKSFRLKTALRIRDSYFGGRTNAIVLHKKCSDGEKGMYLDFTSLYPSVLKYKRYPVGHPEKVFNPDNWAFQLSPCTTERRCGRGSHCPGFHSELPFFGILKVTVKAPRNMLYPVLPIKMGSGNSLKLLFPLCFKCAENQNQNRCSCTDLERQFTQTYCSPELNFAISCGYEIVHIHEVLHWSESEQYNSETQTGGLFTEYINTFLKVKQEASGYPEEIVDCQVLKDQYIQEYQNHEGISLDKTKIVKNAGLRSLAKLALNSFYGKFGQRTDLRKTQFVTDLSVLVNLLLDRTKRVNDFSFLSENIMQVDYSPNEDFENQVENSNVPIAAFCTCYARLTLLKLMNRLEGRVLYHDTDSVIFTAKPGEYVPPTGRFLGNLTDELACKEINCKEPLDCSGHHIVEFVSCGPKNYSYKLNSGEVFCKVRGFSLNYSNSRVVNFEAMKQALFSWKEKNPSNLVTVTSEIRRDPQNVKIVNKTVTKHYAVVYDKRVVQTDFTSIPFGF